MTFEMEWFGDDVFDKTNMLMDAVSKKVAEKIVDDAKRILKSKAKTTTERGLLSQFSISKSKFKHGGYLAYCQGPDKWWPPYHASFLELGTFKDQSKPFMRPAKKKNQRKANKMFQDGLDKL